MREPIAPPGQTDAGRGQTRGRVINTPWPAFAAWGIGLHVEPPDRKAASLTAAKPSQRGGDELVFASSLLA